MAGQHIVYHLAGRTLALRDRQFYEVNRRGVAHVAKACAGQSYAAGVGLCFFAGGGGTGHRRPAARRVGPARSRCRTTAAASAGASTPRRATPTACPRPSSARRSCWARAIGWGLPLFRSVIRFGVHLSPGLKPQRFSLIHAADLVQLLILAAERGKRLPPLGQRGESTAQGYYFAACEQDPTYADLGRLVAESVGRRVLVIPTAMPVVRTVAAVGEAISQVRHQPLLMNLDKAREIAAGSLALFRPGGQGRFGLRGRRPADRAAASDGRVVSAGRMAVRKGLGIRD